MKSLNFFLLLALVVNLLGEPMGYAADELDPRLQHWEFAPTGRKEFKVIRKGETFFLANSPINFSLMNTYARLFNVVPTEPCPPGLDQKPDLIITTEKPRAVQEFFLKGRVMRVGETCVIVTGDGVFYLPFDRMWFDPPTSLKIDLGKRLQFLRNGQPFLHFVQKGNQWKSELTEPGARPFLVNWELFENMRRSLEEFKATGFIHRAVLTDSVAERYQGESFQMRTDKEEIGFYRLGISIWAADIPGQPFLIRSKDWGFLEKMTMDYWQDSYSGVLRGLLDKTLPTSERVASIQRLRSAWSASIQTALIQGLHDSEEDPAIRIAIAKKLRRHPNPDVIRAAVDALSENATPLLQTALIQILRIKNPKGPRIAEDEAEEARARKVQTWQDWAKSLP